MTWLLGASLTSITAYLVQRTVFKRNPAPLPPGPTPLPILGNLFDLPKERPWLTYAEWGKKFGTVLLGTMPEASIFGQHLIILNSSKAAIEMLDKKSIKYSDRPVLPLVGDLLGCKHSLPLLSYGDTFRETRKWFHRIIGTRAAVEEFSDFESMEIHKFLKRVLTDPERLADHLRMTVGVIALRIAYGYQVNQENDPLINLAREAVSIFSKASAPGAFLVDSIPILKYVPEWVPGAGFQRQAREWKAVMDQVTDVPYDFVKGQIEAGMALKSYTSVLLEGRMSDLSEEEVISIKWSASSFFGGGADTSVAALYAMFLAMILFPGVQKKAQAELDAIIGPERLPTLSDRQSLPYMEALVKEVHRWHAVSRLGVPHRTSDDDIHNGYYIPKGSLIIPNIWAMLNNPLSYTEPEEFRPERFLVHDGTQPETDPRTICFGFGRRICPGLQLADASVWLLTAMTLAVFNITKAVEDNVEITPQVDASSLGVSHPESFKCSILPRSAKTLELIQQDIQC
ncbi:hypothetical protein SCLCIDRAFT_24975 [Scleroderma citrinum Foug A]|uniref:Cytochrome P450 n=1 Tax=Scleroderma citrinum Foug A TaxID=1036808 RepID=A0A0C3DP84_9AGAM|nr:hypothetical protein SCLCIDRAFT_24975 [Scleroderma citrinum Foug A]